MDEIVNEIVDGTVSTAVETPVQAETGQEQVQSVHRQIMDNPDGSIFQIKIPIDNLRKKRLFVATPMYGGACNGLFARSMLDLAALCASNGIPLQVYFMFNESLIQRARNYCSDEFMRSGATHMMFIDSDIGFDPRDVLVLMALMDDDTDYDVVGGAYPKKTVSWEKIKQAVDKGMADDNPQNLEKFVGDYVFNPKNTMTSFPVNKPVEVRELGTGFMMIRRKTLEDYARAYPELLYRPDHVRTANFDGSREIMAYFDCAIEPETKRYLSEDYYFSYNVQAMGGKVWLCPWMKLTHTGMYTFGGSLGDLAGIGAHATADAEQLKKMRK
jgi:hypothetical protein